MQSVRDKQRRKIVLKRYLGTVFISNPLITGVMTLIFESGPNFWMSWGVAVFIATIVATVVIAGVAGIDALETGFTRKPPRARVKHSAGWYAFVGVLLCAPGLWLAFKLTGIVAPRLGIDWEEPELTGSSFRYGMLIGGLITVLFFLYYTLADARNTAQKTELRLKEAETQKLQAQLAALAAQMNPHVLFNALNTVASLIATNPEGAEETLLKLSEMYRGVLAASRQSTHSLTEEIRLCRAYLDVEKARFEERLRANVDIPAQLSTDSIQIPVLLLQPLVENAVKHGISARASGGSVVLRATASLNMLELIVEDDGVGMGKSKHAGAGVGLTSCQERIRLHYQERGSFEVVHPPSGGMRVVIRLPLEAKEAA